MSIELDPAATGSEVVSETRNGGVQRIEVDFDRVIELTPEATFEAVDAGSGAIYPASGVSLVNDDKTLVIEFEPGLPDQACYRIDLAGNVVGLAGDTDCLVRALAGDTNGDGYTNLTDMAQVKSKDGQPAFPDNIRFDVNLDGSVNLTDMALVKSLDGNSASCP